MCGAWERGCSVCSACCSLLGSTGWAGFSIIHWCQDVQLDLEVEQGEANWANYMSDWLTDLTDFPIVPPFTGNPWLQHFMSVYSLEQNLCIDEAMCPWRGRSLMRVYMRDKPTKWGIKFYELCESSSGYV
ncbi:hypothetical protein RRG08_022806 [Elysia crispata]|uniref:PiggyBac transposable element-derived protein domain-containing protein n=1 Tax=Elysia crispata TaxID=231223 RepID=A0AAE0Z1G8_9GAST|nr:hypothetical protein RRG08_022806 [Elysia crispata]